MSSVLTRAAVVGAGTMGLSIAEWLAFSGVSVTLQSHRAEALQSFFDSIQKFYRRKSRREKADSEAIQRFVSTCRGTQTIDDCADAEIVIECGAETHQVKQDIFQKLSRVCSAQTILATNTSSLSISEIARYTEAPNRVIGLHFFQPVRFTTALEVIPGDATAPQTIERTLAFVSGSGKRPIQVKECPGFLVNRLVGVYLMAAMSLVEKGEASPYEIDQLLIDWGMQIGPFQIADMIGLDLLLEVAGTMQEAYGDKFRASPLHRELVARGSLGKKTGQGIYVYDPPQAERVPAFALEERLSGSVTQRAEVILRVLAPLINEAVCCLQEGIASRSDIDIAPVECMLLPKGPFVLAEEIGLRRLHDTLEQLADADGEQWRAASLLKEWVKAGNSYSQ